MSNGAPDYDATPVDGDPFAEPAPTPDTSGWLATPVDHDPFAQPSEPQAHPGFAASADGAWANMPYPNQLTQPAAADMPPMSADDRDKLIKTVAGEAGNQGPAGQAAVAHVIMNRTRSGQYGATIGDVVTEPVKPGSQYHQFSVWNPPGVAESSKITHNLDPSSPQYQAIGNVVDKVQNGIIPDPTGGAFHYYAPASMQGHKTPDWAPALADLNDVRIVGQRFVGRPIQRPETPTPYATAVAGGYDE